MKQASALKGSKAAKVSKVVPVKAASTSKDVSAAVYAAATLLALDTREITANELMAGRTGYPIDDELRDLASDIGRNGQLQPVGVRSVGNDRYELVFGGRRLQAVKLWNSENPHKVIPVRAMVLDVPTDVERFSATVSENLRRKQTNPMDDAHNIGIYQDTFALSADKIAKRLGRTPQWVRKTAKLLTLEPEVKEAIIAGLIGWLSATNMVDLPREKQLEILEEIKLGASSSDVSKKVREAAESEGKKAKQSAAPKMKDLKALLVGLQASPVASETLKGVCHTLEEYCKGKLTEQAAESELFDLTAV